MGEQVWEEGKEINYHGGGKERPALQHIEVRPPCAGERVPGGLGNPSPQVVEAGTRRDVAKRPLAVGRLGGHEPGEVDAMRDEGEGVGGRQGRVGLIRGGVGGHGWF